MEKREDARDGKQMHFRFEIFDFRFRIWESNDRRGGEPRQRRRPRATFVIPSEPEGRRGIPLDPESCLQKDFISRRRPFAPVRAGSTARAGRLLRSQ